MIKTIILLLLVLIIIKDRNKTDRTVKFLTFRIVLSVSLFVLLAVSFFMGWIQPHGLLPPSPQ